MERGKGWNVHRNILVSVSYSVGNGRRSEGSGFHYSDLSGSGSSFGPYRDDFWIKEQAPRFPVSLDTLCHHPVFLAADIQLVGMVKQEGAPLKRGALLFHQLFLFLS